MSLFVAKNAPIVLSTNRERRDAFSMRQTRHKTCSLDTCLFDIR
ncbi:uncharacterized protein [Blastocystis hominis]|uniref:Uncharacterized protein n=1 Tax=Blastocystis hominis TaxID=12968 RepID=D8M614_BLAHO|nr:uncharacterized protein [Blastocystis hominis]CBK23613.2 unnamed protein product [Blastocystis hominis]|eukprot:XP_012897661.1 uncharacterized protein [Blastocystis hominis]